MRMFFQLLVIQCVLVQTIRFFFQPISYLRKVTAPPCMSVQIPPHVTCGGMNTPLLYTLLQGCQESIESLTCSDDLHIQ